MLNTLFTNDVRQTLDQFRRSVDQMFENFYGYGSPMQTTGSEVTGERVWSFSPTLEAGWTDNSLNLRAILPGVSDKDIHVSIQNNQLVLEGERKQPEGAEKTMFAGLRYGKFRTAAALPAGLDMDHVQCRLHDGILDIQIPVSEASKPRQIQIQTSSEQKAIGA